MLVKSKKGVVRIKGVPFTFTPKGIEVKADDVIRYNLNKNSLLEVIKPFEKKDITKDHIEKRTQRALEKEHTEAIKLVKQLKNKVQDAFSEIKKLEDKKKKYKKEKFILNAEKSIDELKNKIKSYEKEIEEVIQKNSLDKKTEDTKENK